MNKKCQIFLSLKVGNNEISYRIKKKVNGLENIKSQGNLFFPVGVAATNLI